MMRFTAKKGCGEYILNNVYKSMARFTKKHVENYTRYQGERYYNNFYILDYECETFNGSGEEYDSWLENIFIEKWGMPNQWNIFNINIDKEYKISKINIDRKTPFENDLSPEILFAFFTELSESSIDKFESNIQFLNLIYQFSL